MVSMQNAALASTLASSISDSFAIDEERTVSNNEFHSLFPMDASRIARLDSALMKDTDENTQDPSEQPSNFSVHPGEMQSMRRAIRLKMTSPEATLTVTNNFQGLASFDKYFICINIIFHH